MSDAEIQNSLNTFYGLELDKYQKVFRDEIWNEDRRIVFCNARSGSGKTTVALGVANLLYYSGRYNGIVYIISPTQEMRQGYLPGDAEAKSAPYMEPLYDALQTINVNPMTAVTSSENIQAQKSGLAYIHAIPHTYLRGTNLENKVVLLDESQNFYVSDLKKTLSRIHDNCKTIVIGHMGQIDLYKNPKNTGFKKAIDLYMSKEDSRAAFCELKINHRGWVSSVADELESEIKA
jgi:predicted ribonuclease YlaK